MSGGHERLPAFGACTFSIVIKSSMVQEKEKIAGVDCMMR
jgi:hypothetical protein